MIRQILSVTLTLFDTDFRFLSNLTENIQDAHRLTSRRFGQLLPTHSPPPLRKTDRVPRKRRLETVIQVPTSRPGDSRPFPESETPVGVNFSTALGGPGLGNLDRIDRHHPRQTGQEQGSLPALACTAILLGSRFGLLVNDLPPLVLPASRADTVRERRRLAVGADAQVRSLHTEVVGAPGIPTGLGNLFLRNRHAEYTPFTSPSVQMTDPRTWSRGESMS